MKKIIALLLFGVSFCFSDSGTIVTPITAQQEIEKPSQKTAPAVVTPKKSLTIVVSNNIQPAMLDYSYLFVSYHPTVFTLTVQGKIIEPGQKNSFTVQENEMLKITYYTEFKNGYRKSSRSYIYKINSEATTLDITFNWHKNPRIIATGNVLLQSVELHEV